MAMERGGIGNPWRVDQDHPLAVRVHRRKHWKQQAEFTQAGRFRDQFCYGPNRPAPARQLCIQPCMAGSQGALAAVGLVSAPQLRRGGEQRSERRSQR